MKAKSPGKSPEKSTYTIAGNLAFLLQKSWQIDKSLMLVTVLQVPVLVLLPLCTTYLSSHMVKWVQLLGGKRPDDHLAIGDAWRMVNRAGNSATWQLTANILTLSAILLLLHLADRWMSAKTNWGAMLNRIQYLELCSGKAMDMDYDKLEDPKGQTKMQKALNTIYSSNAGAQQLFRQLVNMVSCLSGLLLYSALIAQLSLWLVLLLAVMTLAAHFINKANNAWNHRHKDDWVPLDRKLSYIRSRAGDTAYAKDIRLYGMQGWLENLFESLLGERMAWYRKGEGREMGVDVFSGVLTFVRDGAAYGFLIFCILERGMTAADFVFYFGLISQYSAWLLGVIGHYSEVERTSLGFGDVREFLDIEDTFLRKGERLSKGKHGQKKDLSGHRSGLRGKEISGQKGGFRGRDIYRKKEALQGEGFSQEKDFTGNFLPTGAPEITFRDVSFTYPGSAAPTLSHINFTIKKGEKLALVGSNGAGKTTLVKLLCGLYQTSEGQVLVAGKDVRSYDRDEYYTLLSAVFQEIYLLPTTLEKNVALCKADQVDREKLKKVLQLSGMDQKVNSLPKKEQTILMKGVREEGTDLSGGEKQKLALARALYKGGSIIVLDEPTAALDPVAENEIYQRYNELTRKATSVFISHRLSSTRFCDRILFLEQGRIVEEGTHDELMALGGKYAAMYEIQSRYYKEGV